MLITSQHICVHKYFYFLYLYKYHSLINYLQHNMNTSAYKMNRFTMQMEIGRIFELEQSKITTKQFKLFSIDENTFVITITTIKKEGIWFDTSWYDVNKFKINVIKHRIFSKNVNLLVEEILNRLSTSEIEQAEDIELKSCAKAKIDCNYQSTQNEQEKPRFKRSEPRQQPVVRIMSTLIKPSTEAEKRQSKLERQLFHDPKMWKYQECQNQK